MSHEDSSIPAGSRPITKAPGYRICDGGIVWSCWSNSGRMNAPWHTLKNRNPNKDGYIQIGLVIKGQSKKWQPFIHQLVIEAFKGTCQTCLECCHNDGNPANNFVYNLRYDTPKNNQADRRKHGTLEVGEQCVISKLIESQVREIFRLNYIGINDTQISLKIGISRRQIRRILCREAWSHLVI
jgi:hypothetical protein